MLIAAPAEANDDPLHRYAEGTWASFVGMTDEHTGLPADFVHFNGTRSTPTSPTNIEASTSVGPRSGSTAGSSPAAQSPVSNLEVAVGRSSSEDRSQPTKPATSS